MLNNTIEEIRREKAEFARDREYLKETALDDEVDARMERVESMYVGETMEELEEAAEIIKKLPAEEDVMEERAEIEKILNSDENLTFEEMAGIE